MNKVLVIFFLLSSVCYSQNSKKIICNQGQVSFFSYTSVENIKAENNQVLSIINLENGEIAVSLLMNTFIFEKALMKEHFNESYIESDLYPKATFEGEIIDFDKFQPDTQIKIIKGVFTMRNISKPIDIKTTIIYSDGGYTISGNFETLVKDYNINIPPLLAGNIAQSIQVNFKFNYEPYEE